MAEPRNSDFKLPQPQQQQQAPATSKPAPMLQDTQRTANPALDLNPLPTTTLSSENAIIGVAIVLACGVAFFFVRGGVRSHLIARRASPSAAGSVGWSLFAFLLVMTITIVFGLLGNLWQVLPFLIPMGVLILVTLIVFGTLYKSATRSRR